MKDTKTAPPDASANAAWNRIMDIARANCLVISGGGGVVTLATPKVQRESKLRAQTLRMHGARENPENPER